MGSVTASPVIMMVLMLALCRVCTTGEGGWWEDGVCDCLTCDHDGPDVGSVQGVYNWRGGGGRWGL